MNRILLVYHTSNTDAAETIDHKLSRIGIPFEHITDIDQPIATTLTATNEPILMLISDNFLKNRHSMEGVLEAISGVKGKNQILIVLCDGKDADGNRIETQIDRMVNALHYMSHWQNKWIGLSEQYQDASGDNKDQIEQELDKVQGIANQIGDFIGVLREMGYISIKQLESNDFEHFFKAFGLTDWHGQYRHLEHPSETAEKPTDSISLPETPVLGGILSPIAMPDLELKPLDIDQEIEVPSSEPIHESSVTESVDPITTIPLVTQESNDYFGLPSMESLLENINLTESEIAELAAENSIPKISDADIEQTIADAHFWIEKGQSERGFALFEAAIEQYPQVEAFKLAYEQSKVADLPPMDSTVVEETTIPTPGIITPNSENQQEEARSYEMMGDMAAAKGDYLFAKYCWDRASEIDPNYPNIFSKLGIMTAEHLRDYKETAIHYLHKALEHNPNDAPVYLALAQYSLEHGDQADAQQRYDFAVSLDNNLKSKELDALFAPKPVPDPAPESSVIEPVSAPNVPQNLENTEIDQAPATVLATPPIIPNGKIVLITGATSGIGKATAALFAQNGYRLILTGRRIDRLIAIKKHFEETWQTEMLMLPFDVRDAGAVEAALHNLPEGWQDIDVLVNNAGLAKGLAPIHEGDIEHWETMIDTNIKGLLYVTRFVAPNMVKRRQGHIINICSTAGKETYPNGNVYSATKFAVDALTKSMRFDLHQHNIKVSQVSPGHVEETEFALTRFDGDAERAKIYNDFQPLKSSDVAEVIYFMATRPAHVNVQDVLMMATQQASAMMIDRSGR